jgi:hypothetical protein
VLKRISLRLREAMRPDWPMPKVTSAPEPVFLFLLTAPYSGSTAIADFMAQSTRFGALQERYEGHWLIKGLCDKDRWEADKSCNLESVRRVWLDTVAKKRKDTPELEYIIEKSPPNMVRYRDLADQFENVRAVCNNRNPYANISSIANRRNDFQQRDPAEKIRMLETLAHEWLEKSALLKDIAEKEGCPLLSYEDFCANPMLVLEKFSIPAEVTSEFDKSHEVVVKRYPSRKIVNMNVKQFERLLSAEKQAIRAVLAGRPDIVTWFGYTVDLD